MIPDFVGYLAVENVHYQRRRIMGMKIQVLKLFADAQNKYMFNHLYWSLLVGTVGIFVCRNKKIVRKVNENLF